MPGKLDALLDRIDPERTLEEADRCVDTALNTFQIPSGVISRWEDFRACLLRFHRHAEQKILGITDPLPGNEQFHWGRCLGALHKAFGSNGEKAAFEIARTGVEGGLRHVLREVARVMSGGYSDEWIAGWVSNYWNSLSPAEKRGAPDEYLRQFGHLLPNELTEASAARIRADFPRFLIEHPTLVRRLREAARHG